MAALVQPWPLEQVSLTDRVPGWDPAVPGMDLLQETRGDQPGQAAGASDWQPPLRRGAAIGAALVAAMGLVASTDLKVVSNGHPGPFVLIVKDAKVVGSCDGGTKKIVYKRQ